MMNGLERITVNPLAMSGKPCIRGLRVRWPMSCAFSLRATLPSASSPPMPTWSLPHDACLLWTPPSKAPSRNEFAQLGWKDRKPSLRNLPWNRVRVGYDALALTC